MVFRLKIETDPSWLDAVANRLWELGLGGVEIVSERPRGVICTYIESTESTKRLKSSIGEYLDQLQSLWPEAEPFQFSVSPLENQDWANAWKAFFKPTIVTPHLAIRPSWEEFQPGPGMEVLVIDPKMAFGTGTHETTRLAIEALDGALEKKELRDGEGFLDVGCGTGILALAAVILGAPRALGIDTDPEAVE